MSQEPECVFFRIVPLCSPAVSSAVASCGLSASATGTEEETTQAESREHQGDQMHSIESSQPSAVIYSKQHLDFSSLMELSSKFITLPQNWFLLPDDSESIKAASSGANSGESACAGSGSKGGVDTSGIGWEDGSSLKAPKGQRNTTGGH